jgi:probable phosphoglycerate mutase
VVVHLIRHGETDWNREGRLQGRRDIPLNALGRAQAEDVARRLGQSGVPVETAAFLSSPLLRARETTEILRRALGLDPSSYRIDERLAELSFGDWEGSSWRELRRREPDALARRERDKWSFVPPGGESYADLAARLAPIIETLDGMVLVAHGGVARALLVRLGGLSERDACEAPIWQGRVLALADGAHRWL